MYVRDPSSSEDVTEVLTEDQILYAEFLERFLCKVSKQEEAVGKPEKQRTQRKKNGSRLKSKRRPVKIKENIK